MVMKLCCFSLSHCIIHGMQVNTAMLLKNLPPHLRNMIVKGKGAMPVHAAAIAAVQGAPKVLHDASFACSILPLVMLCLV